MRYAFFIILPCSLLLGCKEKSQEVIPEQFSGITMTTSASPDPIGDFDPDDWRPLMNCPPPDTGAGTVSKLPNCTRAYPIYPNPAMGSCIFTYALSQPDSVRIELYDEPGHLKKLLYSRRLPAGLFELTIDLTDCQPKLHRLYFTVMRSSGTLQTYGDISVIR